MATKDFKIRHSLTVSENATIEGNLTLGGNTVSRLLDSDEVINIINENVTGLSDSDLKVVADLRNDVDSDSAKLQALEITVEGLSGGGSGTLDSDNGIFIAGTNIVSGNTNVPGSGSTDNILIGENSGTSITFGDNNILIGKDAGDNITSAGSTVAIGVSSHGTGNTSLGVSVGYQSGAGTGSVGVGYQAGSTSTTGNAVYIGRGAGYSGSGSNSIGIGQNALFASGSGSNNVALGTEAGYSMTTGTDNIALGYRAGYNFKASQYNIAIGYLAMQPNSDTTGDDNIAIGNNAGHNITGGTKNLAMGYYSGAYLTSGINNTLIGASSGRLLNGAFATQTITTGGNNIAIGYNAPLPAAGDSNVISIGDSEIARLIISGLTLDTADAGDGQVLAWNTSTGGFDWTTVSGGSVDSDVAEIAQLRRDADSDSLRIQEIATSLEQINELVDSDLKAIADLRNDVDSDSIKLQSLSVTVDELAGFAPLTITRYDYTATQSQTVFSGDDDNGNSLSYVATKIQVYLNGVLLLDGTDYTAINGTSLTLIQAADSDDRLSIIKYLGADAAASDNINVTRFTYKVVSAGVHAVGDSEFTGADDNGNVLSYVAGKIQVYSNGILLEDSDDYVATNGSSIVLRAAPDSDDVVTIFKYLGTTQSGFDSDQVVAIINENASAGFDSDQVVAIIDENPSHPTISAASSVNNSGNTFIQDITLDSNGHITSLTSATATSSGGLGIYGTVNSTGTAASATGTDAIAIGETSKAPNTGNISIGANAGPSGLATNDQISIGTYAGDKLGVYNQTIQNGPIYIGGYCGSRMQNDSNNVGIGQGTFHPTMSTQMNINHTVAIGGQNHRQYSYGASSYNVGVGYRAHEYSYASTYNTSIGALAGKNITTGGSNTFIGYNAGYNCSTTSNNIAIGTSNFAGNYSDSIVIGNSLTSKGNNTTYIGGSSSIYNQVNTSTWQVVSDQRIKTNITAYTNGLNKLDLINVKTYNYKTDSEIAIANPELADSDGNINVSLNSEKTVVGLIAQELETVLPNSVITGQRGIKSIDTDELFWVMLNSIKELKARVEALENN